MWFSSSSSSKPFIWLPSTNVTESSRSCFQESCEFLKYALCAWFFFFFNQNGTTYLIYQLEKNELHILVSASSFLLFRKFCPSERARGSPYGACSAQWEPFTGLGIQWAFGKPAYLKIKVAFSSRLHCLFKGVILVSTYAISCLISQ